MLELIREANSQCGLAGYDPLPATLDELVERTAAIAETQRLRLISGSDDISDTYSKICCLEVLEHLSSANQAKEIERLLELLDATGTLIVSVPIEVGIPSLCKNLARLCLRQTHGNTSLKTILRSLFGMKIERGDGSFIHTHIGFYYQDLERVIRASGLEIVKRVFSPIKPLGRLVNSQVFFVLRRAHAVM